MKTYLRASSITRSLKALFSTKKRYNAHEQLPDRYYRNVYLSKNIYQGVEIVAQIERISKKNSADFLLEAGLSKYMGKKIADYIEAERLARQKNEPVVKTRFNIVIRRYARAKGLKIGDIFWHWLVNYSRFRQNHSPPNSLNYISPLVVRGHLFALKYAQPVTAKLQYRSP